MDKETPPVDFKGLFADPAAVTAALRHRASVGGLDAEYRPWRKLRHLAAERGIDALDVWRGVKFARYGAWTTLKLRQGSGEPFGFVNGNHLAEPLHRIDRATGGGGPAAISADGVLASPDHRTRLHIRTLMDEAAESSIIEGAVTTRKQAVELLRSGRAPQSHADRMVLNNYMAMRRIKEWVGQPLTLQMLIELQGVLTEGTLEDPNDSRRFRTASDPVVIERHGTGEIVFTPPSAIGLTDRLESLCDFANTKHIGTDFVHPIIKACILHFMIGYEHPFCDGNGRTARAIFYWFALRHGYSIFEFIPISERIRAGSARYYQAFVDTEQDDGDLTYFITYKLDIIEQALDRLAEHLKHEDAKLRESEQMLKLSNDLSLRQRLLLSHALRNPLTLYTVLSHSNSHNITRATARKDLEDLVSRKLMTTSKRGKEVIYHPAPTLRAKLDRKSR